MWKTLTREEWRLLLIPFVRSENGYYEILAKYIKLAYIYLVCNVKDETQKLNKFIYSSYHEEEKKH